MSFSDDVKLKAQSAMKPYLAGDYPPHVKNPILLLNYLHQHAIIPSPRYLVISVQNHSQHAVSCQIGDLQVIGNGDTNKAAKTNAAQQIIELLLKPVNISSIRSSLNSFTSLLPITSGVCASVSSNYVANGSKNHLSSLNTDSGSRIENYLLNRINKLTSTAYLVKPQSSQDEKAQIYFQPNDFPEEKMDTTETVNTASVNRFQITPSLLNKKPNYDSDKLSEDPFRASSSTVAHQLPDCDDFFDPFKMVKRKRRSKVSSNTNQAAYSVSPQPSKKTSDDKLKVYLSAVSYEESCCNDFFDPFFKQRPSISNGAPIMETNDAENHVQKQANKSNGTDSIPNVMENKNVFALLQKKTQKHLKLIPRFRIESIESGFQCSVRIGSYYACGEGKNKKEAKTKAAINLLNEIEDLN